MSEQSQIPAPTPDDDVVPHQERFEFIIAQKLEEYFQANPAAIGLATRRSDGDGGGFGLDCATDMAQVMHSGTGWQSVHLNEAVIYGETTYTTSSVDNAYMTWVNSEHRFKVKQAGWYSPMMGLQFSANPDGFFEAQVDITSGYRPRVLIPPGENAFFSVLPPLYIFADQFVELFIKPLTITTDVTLNYGNLELVPMQSDFVLT